MDKVDIGLLNDIFYLYYRNAKKAQEKNDIELAKRNYLLASECMMKMAKASTEKLREARMERAKRLIIVAQNLVVNEAKQVVDGGNGQKDANLDEDEDKGKAWQSAKIPNIKFADIAGLIDAKKAITTRMINPIKYPEKYAAYDKKTGGGVLLYGPPGTGKTMIARAIACEVGATFYAIKGSDIVSKWVGESEKNINSLFETARKDKLAIIFIDEMDSLLGARGVDTCNDKRVNEFLQQIDGFVGRNPNLLLLGATNRPWDIDRAATRSGRFSQKIYIPLPDDAGRKFLFKKFFAKAPLASDVDIGKLSQQTEGYSGADIEELCDRAKENPLLKAIEIGEIVKITMADLLSALKEVKPTVSEKEIKQFESYAGISGTKSREKEIIDDVSTVKIIDGITENDKEN